MTRHDMSTIRHDMRHEWTMPNLNFIKGTDTIKNKHDTTRSTKINGPAQPSPVNLTLLMLPVLKIKSLFISLNRVGQIPSYQHSPPFHVANYRRVNVGLWVREMMEGKSRIDTCGGSTVA